MNQLLLTLLLTTSAMAQEITWTLVTSTNVVFWSSTNIPPPIGYALYTSTSGTLPGAPIRRVTTLTNEITGATLFAGATNALYCVGVTALLQSGVETQRSTNIWLYWVPSPSIVPSGIVGIGVR